MKGDAHMHIPMAESVDTRAGAKFLEFGVQSFGLDLRICSLPRGS